MRWDRSGLIVSETFDIIEQPHYLCQFFWRFSRLSDPARGYDSTVEAASQAEENIFRLSIQAHLLQQITLDPASDAMRGYLNVHYKPGRVTAIRMQPVANGAGIPVPRKLLISRPICIPLSPSGRCTRTYWAVVVDETDPSAAPRDVWLLKDTWRIFDSSGARDSADGEASDGREGSIMQHLLSKGVPNVPPVVDHWDVVAASDDIQSTVTQRYLDAAWVSKGGDKYRLRRARVVHRVHYRLVLKIAGFDLLQISSTEELLYATHDAFKALLEAYNRTNRLHRDVHPGNIILYRDDTADATRSRPRTGYLIDWENSCGVNTASSAGSIFDYEPSLQWQFLSWELASGVSKTHRIMDDVESIIYVVIYCGMLRLRCELARDRMALVEGFHVLFDTKKPFTDTNQGGGGKLNDILYLETTNDIKWTSTALLNWVSGAYALRKSALNPSHPSDNRWNLKSVAQFWASFFAQNPELPRDDRAVNVMSREVYFSCAAPRIALGTVFQPTIISQMQRSGTLVVSDLVRGTKRARTEPNTGATYDFATVSMAEEAGGSTKKQKSDGQEPAKPKAGRSRGGRSKRGRVVIVFKRMILHFMMLASIRGHNVRNVAPTCEYFYAIGRLDLDIRRRANGRTFASVTDGHQYI
ncbi:hypothetical protein NUW54_g368 [Trametes sanguinea]|uniref:Uncharacterized protein n=1 Tax=Trametes sanguinea TaxID=158606 RepID=A0ACC1Q9Y4_9APHY|nr:hypothetical protein NUW54_g368 [Trametes sanguinea]